MASPKLVWLDLETTGLNEQFAGILEIAVATADFDRPFDHVHVYESTIALSKYPMMDDVVLTMHTKSGLLEDCRLRGERHHRVAEEVFAALPVGSDLVLAGSSVHFDARFLRRYMPDVMERFSHRYYDVSAVKLFAQSLGMPLIAKAEAHRARVDIDESVAHARACAEWLGAQRV